MPHITSVVFDFGNVLSEPQGEEWVAEMSRLAGATVDRLMAAYRAHRRDYDGGLLDGAAYWQLVIDSIDDRPDGPLDDDLLRRLVTADIASWTQMRPSMLDWVHRLKEAGFKLGILSNMPSDHGEEILRDFDWIKEFDAIAFSYRLKATKPHEPIYRAALELLASLPAQTLFIDDIEENVEGARRIGMEAIHFRDVESLRAELTRYPGIPLP